MVAVGGLLAVLDKRYRSYRATATAEEGLAVST